MGIKKNNVDGGRKDIIGTCTWLLDSAISGQCESGQRKFGAWRHVACS